MELTLEQYLRQIDSHIRDAADEIHVLVQALLKRLPAEALNQPHELLSSEEQDTLALEEQLEELDGPPWEH